MERLLPVAMLLICFSCLTEDSANPGRASTFVRYYNGGFDDQAQAFDETPDGGFIILATTQITDNNVTIQPTKIKLIKTDQYGNTVWQTLYPAFDDNINTSYYKGRFLVVETDGNNEVTGYTIVGDSIDVNTGVSYLYVLRTGPEGEPLSGKSLKLDLLGGSLANIQGYSIAKDSDENYLVLGARTDGSPEDMVLAKLDKNDLSLEWLHEYGEGESTHVTGLITDADNNIYWGGTVNQGSETDIRLVYTVPNSETAFGPPVGNAESNEEIGGMCYSTFGPRFLFVGTTDENGNKDILYKQLSLDGSELFSKIVEDGNEIPEEGNAICTTKDGGPIILGTSGLDEARDYYLIKLDIFGEVVWSRIFGSKKADTGVSIKQTADGSYVILGSTTLGGLAAIMLMKTGSRGNIQ